MLCECIHYMPPSVTFTRCHRPQQHCLRCPNMHVTCMENVLHETCMYINITTCIDICFPWVLVPPDTPSRIALPVLLIKDPCYWQKPVDKILI